MNALRTIIWVAIAVAIAIFSSANWIPVEVTVWPGRVLATKLPVLIISAFLLGSLPLWIVARTANWNMRRKLDASERQLSDLRAAQAAAAAAATPVVTTPAPLHADPHPTAGPLL